MKIIIAGAGDVGFHLAQLLSFENQYIVLIDVDQDVLDYASTHLDVLTIHGDASSIDIMKEAGVDTSLMQIDPDLPTSEVLITLDDENNARYEIPHPVAWDRLEMDPEVSRLISGSDIS